MYLLDTNVVSELRRRDRTDVTVARWVDAVRPADLYLSVIALMELEMGALSRARHDPAQGRVLTSWIEGNVLPAFENRILPVDVEVARRCAALHVPDPRSPRDALIAATALVHGLTVATRNVRDFEATGTSLLNPWNWDGR